MNLEAAAAWLKARDSFIIASHDGPDADGLGASYALTLALRAVGKTAVPVLADAMPAKFRFIDRAGVFLDLSDGSELPFPAESAAFILMDTADTGYLGARAETLLERSACRLVIDHHEPRGERAEGQFIDASASSTCELVFFLAGILGARLPVDAAEALFAGIVYDTGSFAYPKTGEGTFACALELMRIGVKPYEIHSRMYESASIGVLILQKAVFATLELHAGNRIAVQMLRKADLAASGASYEDAEDFVNGPLRGRTVEVSVFFKENLEGKLRCSIRSKGGVNVARIAQGFGGGGHRTAAGFTCDRPLERMHEAVLESIVRSLDTK